MRTRVAAVAAALIVLAGVVVGGVRVRSARAGAALPPDARAGAVHTAAMLRLDTLAVATDSLHAATLMLRADAGADEARRAFVQARLAFKRAEYLLEYLMPMSADQMNGPPLDDVELDEGPTVIAPREGFQVIEAILYPAVDTSQLDYLRSEARILRDNAQRPAALARTMTLTDAQVFDALRMEIARVVTLGLTGFDSPVHHASLTEAAEAIGGVGDAFGAYRSDLQRASPGLAARVDALLDGAVATLAAGDFDKFDRLGFIVGYANPLAAALAAARDTLGIAVPTEPRFWRATAPTLFDSGAFDPDVLRPAWAPATTDARAELGRRLFHDPVLSGAGPRSCASCHRPERAFSEPLARSVPLTRGAELRNAPSLINAALQGAQFADMRTVFLEDQIAAVVSSAAEMHGDLAAAAPLLSRDSAYAPAFAAAYGRGDSIVTADRIRNAVAAYLRTLVRLDSPVDRALRGDTAALSPTERAGFNLFAGRAMCATCHFLPLTGGTVPPSFVKTEQEVIGVPASPRWSGASVSPDRGREGVTRAPLHQFAFRTPILRNAALTAPYMHNGVYRTLDEVVRFYDVGGGAGIGIELPNQTLPFDKLNLTAEDRRALVAFLTALSDTARTTALPPR